MEISDLRVFKAVVEEGGVTNAAKTLHRVPSNVTARIQKLEKELGKALFIRDRKRLVISSSGQLLMEYADKILQLADHVVDVFNNDTPQGTLKLGAMEAVAATRLADPLVRYHRQYPSVNVDLSTGPSGVLTERVIMGELDIALVADPVNDERLTKQPVFDETLVAITSLNVGNIQTANDFGVDSAILVFSERCAYRKRLLNWFSEANVVPQAMEIRSYHALMVCAVAGMGVGIVPESIIAAHPTISGLKVHKLPGEIADSITYAVWRKDALLPSIDAFYQCICG